MKLINKVANTTIGDLYAIELITDSVTYSFYENHKTITLLLRDASITHINENGMREYLAHHINGIAILENNILYYAAFNETK